MKPMTLTDLRADIYNAFAKVGKTGVPLKVKGKGKKFKIVLDETEPDDIFSKLTPRKTFKGDPDELLSIKVDEWHELENLESS